MADIPEEAVERVSTQLEEEWDARHESTYAESAERVLQAAGVLFLTEEERAHAWHILKGEMPADPPQCPLCRSIGQKLEESLK